MELNVETILILLGGALRALGSLVFGVGVGWLVLKVLKEAGKTWQLVAATLLGLLGAFVVVAGWGPSSTTTGSFALGAGAALLIWGLAIKPKKE